MISSITQRTRPRWDMISFVNAKDRRKYIHRKGFLLWETPSLSSTGLETTKLERVKITNGQVRYDFIFMRRKILLQFYWKKNPNVAILRGHESEAFVKMQRTSDILCLSLTCYGSSRFSLIGSFWRWCLKPWNPLSRQQVHHSRSYVTPILIVKS